MSRYKFIRVACLAVVALGGSFVAERPVFAVGCPVAVDPNCDQCCEPGCCQRFCRKLKLHCVYFKRSCTQKYVVMPVQSNCPEIAPPDCPTYSTPNGYPTINGYGNPHVPYGPSGVFIR